MRMRGFSNFYRLVTRWVVDGTPEEVAAILSDTSSLVRWYPATCLEANVLKAGEPNTGMGKVVRMQVKGWMPHTLRFMSRVVASRPPHEFALEVWGDFEGRLICSLVPEGKRLTVCFDWQVGVTKPFVRYLSWILRPLFVSNHLWVVARGEESLGLELRQRRAAAAGMTTTGRPPGPTFPSGPISAYIQSRVWSRAALVELPSEPATPGPAAAR